MSKPQVLKQRGHGNAPVRIAERDESKLSRRVHNQILGYSTQVRHRQTGPHHELGHKVPIPHSIEAVLGNRIEPKLFRQKLPINNERVSGEGSRPKREDRNTRDQFPQALKIGGEVEGVGEDEMRPSYRLGALNDQVSALNCR